ncbi:Uncharacterised protein [Mycobacterium tuberculosis]|nr:Uncharacterised protein [Mycobacterium tuberculosis]
MWPGPDPPTGPPTGAGPPPRIPARHVAPGAGWYALPVVLVVVAALGFLTMLAMLWDDRHVADGPPAVGDPVAGMRVQLSEGYGYFVYVRTGGSSPYLCAVEVGERAGPVRLTRKNSRNAAERAGYRYTATFRAPVSGSALLTCHGTDGLVLVVPDDTVYGYLFVAFLAAASLGGAAALTFAAILVQRGGARRRAAAAAAPGH